MRLSPFTKRLLLLAFLSFTFVPLLAASTTDQPVLVADINPGAGDSDPIFPTIYAGQLYFRANDGTHGNELWRYNSTKGTASLVADILPGAGSSGPINYTDDQYPVVYNGQLYFGAYDGTNGYELWRYDNTSNTASLVADIWPGGGDSLPIELTVYNGQLYFSAEDPVNGWELWRYDSGTDTASLAADIYPGGDSSIPLYLTVYNGQLYFAADNGITGGELWAYDSVTDTVSLIADIYPGGSSSFPFYTFFAHPTVYNGQLYFNADNGPSGYELFRHNSVTNNTNLVADIYPGPFDSEPWFLTVYDGQLYFNADDGTTGWELWAYDSVTDIVSLAADIYPGGDSDPWFLTVHDGLLYFSADDGTTGYELWSYDSSDGKTSLVADIFPDEDSDPAFLTVYNGQLYFNAEDSRHGRELWMLDTRAISPERTYTRRFAVDSDGGEFYACSWSVTVPPDTVPDGSQLVINCKPDKDAPDSALNPLDHLTAITINGPKGQPLHSFTNMLNMCYQFSTADVVNAASNTGNLVIGTAQNNTAPWSLLPTSPGEKKVCASTNHLSLFEVFLPKLPNTGFAPDRVTNLPQQPQSVAYAAYNSLNLKIPTLGVDSTIVGVPLTSQGWDVRWLDDYIGYLQGSAFPTWEGNTVLTGHVYGADGLPGVFVDLHTLQYDDHIFIHAWGQTYTYAVREVERVRPSDLSPLAHTDQDWLTLLTCQGYNPKDESYSWRYAVRAVLVDVAAE